jgi:hypothetical protein
MLIYHLEDEQWAVGGPSSETQSHAIDMMTTIIITTLSSSVWAQNLVS